MPRDYATELFRGTSQEPQEAASTATNYDYAADLLGIGGSFKPAEYDPEKPGKRSGISTITGKPILEYVPGDDDFADLSTLFQTGFVDDPQTKIKIFAKARGIPEDRYGIVDGEIVFKNNKGNLQLETGQVPLQRLLRFVGETSAHAPAMVMGTVGAIGGGPVAAGIGGAGGEAIRKNIGSLVFGEEQTTTGNVKDIIAEAILTAIGEKLLGEGVIKSVNTRRLAKRGALARAAGRDLPGIDNAATIRNEALGAEFGIDLFPAQTTGSKRLIDAHTLMQDLPATSDIIQEATQKQVGQVETAIGNVIDKTGSDISRMQTGERLVEAAKKARDIPIEVRKAQAGPMYSRAFENAGDVNISPVIDFIDQELVTAKGNVRTGLLKAKKILQTPDLPKTTPAGAVVDSSGKPLVEASRKFDTSLKGLHDAKIAIDDEIAKAMNARTGNVARNYKEIQSRLLKQMDEASPDYAAARQVYSDYSTEVVKQNRKTLLSEIAGLEGDNMEKAISRLLDPQSSTVGKVLKVKSTLQRQDPDAWKAAIKHRLNDIFESIKPTVSGKRQNLAGRFHQAIMDKRQNDILKAAMTTKQYQTLQDFSTVLKMVAATNLKESATVTRSVALKDLNAMTENQFMKFLIEFDVTRPSSVLPLKRFLLTPWAEKNQKKLAEALVSGEAADKLTNIKQLSPGSEKFWKAVGVLTAQIFGSEQVTDPAKNIGVNLDYEYEE